MFLQFFFDGFKHFTVLCGLIPLYACLEKRNVVSETLKVPDMFTISFISFS